MDAVADMDLGESGAVCPQEAQDCIGTEVTDNADEAGCVQRFVRDDVGGIYRGVSDEQLALYAAQKRPLAFSELLNRFTPIMLRKIGAARPCGMDSDDLMQECSLGLLNAVESYSHDGGASFATYAGVCIDNRLRSVLRGSRRDKNKPLSYYLELSELLEQPEEAAQADPAGTDPEAMVLINEGVGELRAVMRSLLSDVEYSVFTLYLAGQTYEEIARRMAIAPKAVDNAIQRVRRKLKKAVRPPNNHNSGDCAV